MQPKGPSDASLREQIVGSVEKKGEPEVYSSIDKCVQHLATQVDDRYSKWLVVLTDTVDFQCVEAAVQKVVASMREMSGLNLVLIDASGIANFNAKHTLWPTWRRLSQKLTDEVGEANSGVNIQAADVSEIDDAFEKIAGAMSGGAAG